MEHIISQNDKLMECISVFDDITERMPQSESAFTLAKQSLTKSLQSRRVTKTSLIAYYFQMKRLGLDYDLYERVYQALPSLTLQDIARFEQQHMTQKPWHYVILGDEKELDMERLEQIAPIKRVSLETIFGY
ncbi:MAG: insulinase family protein, partial [Prevotella sp.]|nr:insulinase family protein [Prevotella sp.]